MLPPVVLALHLGPTTGWAVTGGKVGVIDTTVDLGHVGRFAYDFGNATQVVGSVGFANAPQARDKHSKITARRLAKPSIASIGLIVGSTTPSAFALLHCRE
jgi:hypothetical protein